MLQANFENVLSLIQTGEKRSCDIQNEAGTVDSMMYIFPLCAITRMFVVKNNCEPCTKRAASWENRLSCMSDL